MPNNNWKYCILLVALVVFSCCEDPKPPGPTDDLTEIEYKPIEFEIEYPVYTRDIIGNEIVIPKMEIPLDNPMTVDGVELGRHLFYDKILSADGSQSCASCHLPKGGFTDNFATSIGIDGIAGNRSSMMLYNVGFNNNGLFWDGRSPSLEAQALLPVEDPIELHNTWPEVVEDLRNHDNYPSLFRKAFGIEKTSEITKELAAKAIAQFERSIYSFNSKFDNYLKGEILLSDEELYGLELYFEIPGTPDAQCSHCHSIPLMTSNDYFNNGLQQAETLLDFNDNGLGGVSGITAENGFFRATTLRNIELSAPYMHNGSLNSLEEVMDHYISGGQESPNKDPLMKDVQVSGDFEKEAIIAFLKSMTDTTVYTLERLQSPFE